MNDANRTQPELHVYENDVTEWVVAHSPEDADVVLRETYGDSYEPPEEVTDTLELLARGVELFDGRRTESLPRDYAVEARDWLRRHVSNDDERTADLVVKLASAFSDVANRATSAEREAHRMGQGSVCTSCECRPASLCHECVADDRSLLVADDGTMACPHCSKVVYTGKRTEQP